MRNTLVKPYAVGSIYFSVSNTRNSLCCYLFTLNTRTSEYVNSNFTKCFIFHSIWAKLIYQLFKYCHYVSPFH